MAFEDRAMAYITIFSSLGIAWVADMERRNIFDVFEKSIQEFYQDTITPFKSFNPISLYEEYLRMENEASKVKTYRQEQHFIESFVEDTTSLDKEQSVFASKLLGLALRKSFPHILQVGIHNT